MHRSDGESSDEKQKLILPYAPMMFKRADLMRKTEKVSKDLEQRAGLPRRDIPSDVFFILERLKPKVAETINANQVKKVFK